MRRKCLHSLEQLQQIDLPLSIFSQYRRLMLKKTYYSRLIFHLPFSFIFSQSSIISLQSPIERGDIASPFPYRKKGKINLLKHFFHIYWNWEREFPYMVRKGIVKDKFVGVTLSTFLICACTALHVRKAAESTEEQGWVVLRWSFHAWFEQDFFTDRWDQTAAHRLR